MIWNQLKLHQAFPFLPRFSTRSRKENAQGRREIFRNGQPRGPQRGPDDDIPGGPREIRVGICVYVFANKMMIQKKIRTISSKQNIHSVLYGGENSQVLFLPKNRKNNFFCSCLKGRCFL